MAFRGGTAPYTRANVVTKALQGQEAHRLHRFYAGGGLTFAQVGERLGISATTAWRRWWFFHDWCALPAYYGLPALREQPPQRGTRGLRRLRPSLPMLDHPELRPRQPQRCRAQRPGAAALAGRGRSAAPPSAGCMGGPRRRSA